MRIGKRMCALGCAVLVVAVFLPLFPQARMSRRCAAFKGARADDEEHQPRDAPRQGLFEKDELRARRGGGGGNRAAFGGDSLPESQGSAFR